MAKTELQNPDYEQAHTECLGVKLVFDGSAPFTLDINIIIAKCKNLLEKGLTHQIDTKYTKHVSRKLMAQLFILIL